MQRRLVAAVVAAIVVSVGWASVAQADQATLPGYIGALAPGDTREGAFTLVVAGAGIPNVAYDHGASFAAGETVTATITPTVEPAGFGKVELISTDTLTGTVSADWNTGQYGEFGEIAFGPDVSLRYTAPSLGDLG